MSKPLAVHYIQDYLIPTTQWIYGQIRSNPEFEPLVLSRHLVNPEKFPVENIVAIDQMPAASRKVDELIARLCGFSRFFEKGVLNIQSTGKNVALIHAHFGHIGYKALGLAQRLNLPLITSFYGYDVSALGREPRYRKRFSRLFTEGTLFLAEGPHLAKSLEELGCPNEKIRIFHLGVDVVPLDKMKSTEHSRPDIRVLFAATFTEKKGWADALHAFAQTAARVPQLRLRLIGGGEDEDKVTTTIRELGIEARVDRTSYVTHEQLLVEMQNSDIFLQPSRTAANGNTEGGAPVTLIDAQSMKLAICATTHADIPEVSPHGVSALLAPEGNIRQIGENLEKLALNAELRRELGNKGRTRVETEYNWAIQGPRLAKIYHSCITSR